MPEESLKMHPAPLLALVVPFAITSKKSCLRQCRLFPGCWKNAKDNEIIKK